MNVVSINQLTPSDLALQVLAGTAAGGFPSPAADYYEAPISLDALLNIRAPHVWIVQVEGDSMRDVGIYNGSRLVIDRAITPCAGHVVLAYVDNQPLIKRLARSADGWLLESANTNYAPISPNEYAAIEVFGVVTWCLTPHAL